MKKTLAFLLVLIVLASSLCIVFGKEINKMSTDVKFTLEEEFGDRSLLEGVTFKSFISNERHLIWENTFDPFGETDSKLTFKKIALNFTPPDVKQSLSFHSYSHDFFFDANAEIKAKLENTAKLVKEGESKQVDIKLADYYEYYPLYFTLTLSGTSIVQKYFSTEYISPDYTRDEAETLHKKLSEFLRIPVRDDDIWKIKISKTNGEYAYYCTNVQGFNFCCYSKIIGDKIYFTIRNSTDISIDSPGVKVDTSLIPGGYGIYTLPISDNKARCDSIETVYSIDENSTVLNMYKDESNSYIYLMLWKNGKYVVEIIDVKTMSKVYSEELFDYTNRDSIYPVIKEDFSVFIKNDYEIKVIAKDENGGFSQTVHYLFPEDNKYYTESHPLESEFAYSDGRLIICTPDIYNNVLSVERYLDFEAFVITDNSLSYYGNWSCSLGEYSIRTYPFCTYMQERGIIPIIEN